MTHRPSPPPPLRIVAHNGARTYGGGEKWTVLLLEGLQDRGHQVHLLCNFEEIAAHARAEGVEASVAVLGGHLALWQPWTVAARLRALRPDAFLIATFKKIWLGGMAGRLARVPRVVSRIGLDSDVPGKHWSYRLAFRRWIDAALVNADGIRRDVVAGLPDYPAEQVATVYDGIHLPRFEEDREEARRKLGLPVDVPLVGAVTRLGIQKRIDRMLETVALMPGMHCALAGDGDQAGALEAQARSLGISDRVHFLGFRKDVARVLAALDVFLLTSDREGMANAMLEAMAAGVPVVSTPVSGADEALYVDDEGRRPGVIVAAEPPVLAQAVQEILDDRALRDAMGREALRRARERFSYEAMLDAWEGVLGGDSPARWHEGR